MDSGRTRSTPRLAQANIDLVTGLATDYVNDFNEAIMLHKTLSSCPDCVEDFLAWQPMSYREHFAASRFKDRALTIGLYEVAEPAVRHCVETLAERSAKCLKRRMASADAVINGGTTDDVQAGVLQATVDLLMKH